MLRISSTPTDLRNIRAKSKCLVLPMETNLEAQLLQHEGRFHSFDIVLRPNKNSSNEILWKKSHERKFVEHDKFKLLHTSHTLEIAYVALSPFYSRNKNGDLEGMDANAWKIIGNHLQLNLKFLKAKHMGKTINMVKLSIFFVSYNILANKMLIQN